MGNRLSAIVTRTGDDGTTGLGDGTRVDKDVPLIETIGDIDELNSAIGLARSLGLQQSVQQNVQHLDGMLEAIQKQLFDVGGELSIPGFELLKPDAVLQLDNWLAELNQTLAPLREFILPGGLPPAAALHVARAVCRRAERRVITLHRGIPVREPVRLYLNRLSDLLFVMTRVINLNHQHSETAWRDRDAADMTPDPYTGG